MTLTITHSAEAGTLIEGTARGDGTNVILKDQRWRWGRTISAWYVPNSRDRMPDMWKINATRKALEAAGFEVELDVDESFRSTAEVEADKAARAGQRAECLAAKAERVSAEAQSTYEKARQMGDAIPFGQPMLVDHYSYGRDRRYRERMVKTYDRAFAGMDEAQQTERRAQAAARATDLRYSPVTVANRIEKLATEMRGYQRKLDGYQRVAYRDAAGNAYGDVFAPATGSYRERLEAALARAKDQHDYWVGVREEQIASGQATGYSKDQISKGDQVKIRGTWYEVIRANAKTVTHTWFAGTFKHPYAEIQDHRAAAGS